MRAAEEKMGAAVAQAQAAAATEVEAARMRHGLFHLAVRFFFCFDTTSNIKAVFHLRVLADQIQRHNSQDGTVMVRGWYSDGTVMVQ